MACRFVGRMNLVVAVLVCLAGSASAAEWGTLKGKFVFDGKAPEPEKIKVDKDPQVCGQHKLVDESLMVGKDGGLSNVVLSVRTEKGKKVAVHPDYEKDATAEVVLDNKNCRFNPRITLLRTTQKLVVKNSDAVGHNTNVAAVANPSFNVLIPSEQSVEPGSLKSAERLPINVGCNIHPWMKGYLLVRDDPYMVVSGEDGSFEIKNLPVGEHEFQLWHEKPGYVNGVKLGSDETKKGRVTIKIKPGVNDLGKITVPAAAINKSK